MNTCIDIAHNCFKPNLDKRPEIFGMNNQQRSRLNLMEEQLRQLLSSVSNKELRELALALVQSNYYPVFCLAPAALRYHHNYVGGLLEHSLGTAQIVVKMAELHAEIDRDLILMGAVLHDLGKIREMGFGPDIFYTDEGKLLGHIILGIQMVEDLMAGTSIARVNRSKLLHMIASHHGQYEWHSPQKPQFIEAKILHLADMMDAEIWKFNAAQPSCEGSQWSAYIRSIGSEVYLER